MKQNQKNPKVYLVPESIQINSFGGFFDSLFWKKKDPVWKSISFSLFLFFFNFNLFLPGFTSVFWSLRVFKTQTHEQKLKTETKFTAETVLARNVTLEGTFRSQYPGVCYHGHHFTKYPHHFSKSAKSMSVLLSMLILFWYLRAAFYFTTLFYLSFNLDWINR